MAENADRLFPVERVKRTRRQLRLRRSTDATIELREFGEWTLEKLKVLELYLKQYRRVAGNGTYIDGFAGQGSVAVAGQITDEKGSVRIALEAGAFKELWAFEIKQDLMADLRKNLSYHYPAKKLRRVHLVEGDFNTKIVHLLARK
jgi:three-Cys-motif partner protein